MHASSDISKLWNAAKVHLGRDVLFWDSAKGFGRLEYFDSKSKFHDDVQTLEGLLAKTRTFQAGTDRPRSG